MANFLLVPIRNQLSKYLVDLLFRKNAKAIDVDVDADETHP